MIRVGIIGAGYMADHHLKVLGAIEVAEVTSITSRTYESASKMSQKWGIKNVFESHVEMLDSGEVDVVFICPSVDAMFSITKDVLERSIPCLIEKPVSLSVDDAKQLSDLAAQNNVKTTVGCNRRFISTIVGAKMACQELGGLRHMNVVAHEPISEIAASGQYDEDVITNWIFANGIHCIDLIRFFVGNVEEVVSTSEGQNYSAMIKSGDITGCYVSRSDSKGRWSITLDCVKGRVTLCPLEKTVIQSGSDTQTINLSDIDKEFKPGLFDQNSSFFKFLESDSDKANDFNLSDVHDNLQTMELIDQIVS